MKTIDELTVEINRTSMELEDTKKEISILFKELWKLRKKKETGCKVDEERYEHLVYNNKLLQMKRKRLITHLHYLNKEFYEVLY